MNYKILIKKRAVISFGLAKPRDTKRKRNRERTTGTERNTQRDSARERERAESINHMK